MFSTFFRCQNTTIKSGNKKIVVDGEQQKPHIVKWDTKDFTVEKKFQNLFEVGQRLDDKKNKKTDETESKKYLFSTQSE